MQARQDNIVDEEFYCPISRLIMRHAVIASDGHHYEEDYIRKHIARGGTSPMTREALTKVLHPNIIMRTKVDTLLEKHAELFEQNDVYLPKRLWDELEIAISKKDLAAFKRLVAKDPRLLKLSPNAAQKLGITLADTNLSALTAEEMAIKYGTLTIQNEIRVRNGLDTIVEITDLNAKLIIAVERGDLDEVKTLHANGAHINALGECRNNALQRAIKFGHREIARYLLEQGAAVNHRNANGETAAHEAARKNDQHMLALLQAYQADLNAKTEFNRTPLHDAARAGAIVAVEFLISAGVDVHAKNDAQQTAFFMAASHSAKASIDYYSPADRVENYFSIMRSLKNACADVNTAAIGNVTPLHVCGSPEITQFLLRAGAKADILTERGHSALLNAEYQKAKSLLASLPRDQASALVNNEHVFTQAVQSGSVALLQLYIQYGANVNCKISEHFWGTSPLEIAVRKSNSTEKITLLLDAGATLADDRKVATFNPQHFAHYPPQLIHRVNATCQRRDVSRLVEDREVLEQRRAAANKKWCEDRVTLYIYQRSEGGEGITLFGGYNKTEKIAAANMILMMLKGSAYETALQAAIDEVMRAKPHHDRQKVADRIIGAMHQSKLGEKFAGIKKLQVLSAENLNAIETRQLSLSR